MLETVGIGPPSIVGVVDHGAILIATGVIWLAPLPEHEGWRCAGRLDHSHAKHDTHDEREHSAARFCKKLH